MTTCQGRSHDQAGGTQHLWNWLGLVLYGCHNHQRQCWEALDQGSFWGAVTTMRKPTVSVIIPVYNGRGTIAAAVKSTLAQSFGDFDVLVVDDGSTDGTCDVVDSIHDPRIKLIRHDRHRGAAAARNTGITAAPGTFLAFLDSDDVWLPEKLAKQISSMQNASLRIPATGTAYELHRVPSGSYTVRRPQPNPTWLDSLLDVCGVSLGTTLVAYRRVFNEIGPFDNSLPLLEDWDWLLRYLCWYEFHVLPDVLAKVYVSGYERPEVVKTATKHLFALHADQISRARGLREVRRFQASLLIEQAVAERAHGGVLVVVQKLARAMAISPGRVARFAGRLIRKIAQRDY